MLYDTNIVVTIAFLLFVGLLLYVGVHKILTKKLDERAEKIQSELDEARRLREEAQTMLAGFERRQREVEEQAEAIIKRAHADAEEAAEHAKADIEASVARRIRAAEEQLALAEQSAVREVRDRAIKVAVAAAKDVLSQKLDAGKADALIDSSINTVGEKLH